MTYLLLFCFSVLSKENRNKSGRWFVTLSTDIYFVALLARVSLYQILLHLHVCFLYYFSIYSFKTVITIIICVPIT